MNKHKNEISMGSAIIDIYMDGYDEGKDDEVVEKTAFTKRKHSMSIKERTSNRRKKAYYKSRSRQATLKVHYNPSPKRAEIINGILRNHQLPMSETKCEHPCGVSIGNKRRLDATEQKLKEVSDYHMDCEATAV